MIGLALFILAGAPAARLADREAPLLRFLGESLLLGIAICTGVLYAMSLLGIAWNLPATLAILAVITIAFFALATRRCGWSMTIERPHLFDLLTIATLAGYALFATAGPPSDNDFLAIWGLKAAAFAQHGGIDWSFLRSEWYRWDHPDYPLLLPLAFDFMTLVARVWQPETLTLLYPALAAAILLIVRSLSADEFASPLFASLATAGIAPLAMSPWIGIAEAPLIAFGTAAILLARRRRMTISSLFLGCAAMTKNEGLALLAAVALALLLTRRFRDVARLWPSVLIVLPWLIARTAHSLTSDVTAGPMFARVFSRLQNPRELVSALGTYKTGEPLLWVGIAVALLLAICFAAEEAFAVGVVAVQVLFYLGAYISTQRDIAWHVRWSWERVVTHVALTLTFVACTLLWKFAIRATPSAPSAARSV
jgi:hypothetical protein